MNVLQDAAGWLRHRTELWTTAIREGFIMLLPLTLIGGFALAVERLPIYLMQVHVFPISSGDTAAAMLALSALARRLFESTMGIMGFASAAAIAARACTLLCARDLSNAPPQISVAALGSAAFLLIVLPDLARGISALGYANIFPGILAGLITAEAASYFAQRMPRSSGLGGIEGRTPMRQAIRMASISFMVLTLFGILRFALVPIAPWFAVSMSRLLNEVLMSLADSPVFLHAAMTVVNQVAWLMGINGGQLLLSLGGTGILPLAASDVAWAPGVASPMFMNAFAHLGGAGATWGLIIAALIWAKDKANRQLAHLSILPGVLNINEILLFGLPLVFNKLMVLPFIAAPVINVIIAVSVVELFDLSIASTDVVWSTPALVSGYALTGSWVGAALQAVLIFIDVLIYAPFLAKIENIRNLKAQQEFRDTLDTLMGPPRATERLLDRPDAVGDIARRLIEDFTIDLRAGRVKLAYQPQHDFEGKVVGIEALLRWHHPHYGMIPPSAVINVAEECEVIHEVGKWVLRQSCRELSKLHKLGHRDLTMSVNMSPLQLEHPYWSGRVESALQEFNLEPRHLEIEITEGRMLSTSEQADLTLGRLQALGVRLSMDDFGMGCTSLLYMQRFNVYAIKLDGSLTKDVLTSAVNQDIILSVVRLGHARGVKVIAEFVETPEQRDMLHQLGCDFFQGWLYSKALPPDELDAYLQQCIQQKAPLVFAD